VTSPRAPRGVVAAVALASVALLPTLVTGCADCRKGDASRADGATSSVASAHPAPTPHPFPPPLPKCRAISVGGTARLAALDGSPLEAGAPTLVAESSDLPDDEWIVLEPGAKVTAKHPQSTRETAFVGPGRVRSCVERAEEAWVLEGKFDSIGSAGERPGAEEWVATPVGVFRYGSAKLEVVVTPATATAPAKAELTVSSGAAYAWTSDVAGDLRTVEVAPAASAVKPPGSPSGVPSAALPAASAASAGVAAVKPAGKEPAKDAGTVAPSDGWTRVEGGRALTLTGKKVALPDELAESAVELCVTDAKAARELALAVASATDGGLGQLAPRHVIARHAAHAACAVAGLRVAVLLASPVRDKLGALVKGAEGEWKVGRPHGFQRHPR
jgi:hypothetical protein